MSKLREKFGNVILNEKHNEQCEQITDDFAIQFAEWKDSNITEFNYHYINSTAELLTIFKEKYYAK